MEVFTLGLRGLYRGKETERVETYNNLSRSPGKGRRGGQPRLSKSNISPLEGPAPPFNIDSTTIPQI
jgi:hypothetical protein